MQYWCMSLINWLCYWNDIIFIYCVDWNAKYDQFIGLFRVIMCGKWRKQKVSTHKVLFLWQIIAIYNGKTKAIGKYPRLAVLGKRCPCVGSVSLDHAVSCITDCLLGVSHPNTPNHSLAQPCRSMNNSNPLCAYFINCKLLGLQIAPIVPVTSAKTTSCVRGPYRVVFLSGSIH